MLLHSPHTTSPTTHRLNPRWESEVLDPGVPGQLDLACLDLAWKARIQELHFIRPIRPALLRGLTTSASATACWAC